MIFGDASGERSAEPHYVALIAVMPLVDRPSAGALKKTRISHEMVFLGDLYFGFVYFDDFLNRQPARLIAWQDTRET